MTAEMEAEIKRWEPGRRLGFRWAIWALRVRGEFNEEAERAAFEEWKNAS